MEMQTKPDDKTRYRHAIEDMNVEIGAVREAINGNLCKVSLAMGGRRIAL